MKKLPRVIHLAHAFCAHELTKDSRPAALPRGAHVVDELIGAELGIIDEEAADLPPHEITAAVVRLEEAG